MQHLLVRFSLPTTFKPVRFCSSICFVFCFDFSRFTLSRHQLLTPLRARVFAATERPNTMAAAKPVAATPNTAAAASTSASVHPLDAVYGCPASSAAGLNEYLALSRKHWAELLAADDQKAGSASKTPTQYVVVLGNEAGDMDSIVCAIVYAYYQSIATATAAPTGAAAAAPVRWLPLINVPAKYLGLRLDTIWLLQRHGVSADALTFIDGVGDLSAWAKRSGASVSVCLVDHNRLTESQAVLAPLITRIVDHHKDDAQYTATVPANRRTVQVIGSCTSLVASELMAHGSGAAGGAVFAKLSANPTVAGLLASTILIGTFHSLALLFVWL